MPRPVQQVRYRRHPEGVRRQAHGEAGVHEAALHHAADVDHVHGPLGELAGLPVRRPEEGSVLAGRAEACIIDAFKSYFLQVVPDRDLAALAVLLVEVEHALVAGVVEAAAL